MARLPQPPTHRLSRRAQRRVSRLISNQDFNDYGVTVSWIDPVDPEFVPVIVTVPVVPVNVTRPGVKVETAAIVESLEVNVVVLVASVLPSFASS